MLENKIITCSSQSEFPTENLLQFSLENYERIKEFEKTTNHDIKAVEYYLKEKLQEMGLSEYSEYIHFLCTSEDINNLAYSKMISNFLTTVYIPKLNELLQILKHIAQENANTVMMARTHGQSASPTTMGKEIANFAYRIQRQIQNIESVELFGKLNGAVGNYNCHRFVLDNVDWPQVSKKFIEQELNLKHNPYRYTTNY